MHFLKGLADCRFGPQHVDPTVGNFCYILRKSTCSYPLQTLLLKFTE